MSSEPAAKRKPASITRSDLWYSDGDVVLQAGNTQFRAHWSILCDHSAIFCDLASLPQPPDQPTVDGCPIVELPDSAEDVEYPLKALYDRSHFLGQPALPLAAVGALIRLGRKYDFQTLCESAVERITFENPTTLEEYDALVDDGGTYTPTRIADLDCDGFPYDMLTLVRENNILSALPVAYYRASRSSPTELLDGIQRKDGSLASLDPLDLSQCLTGRSKLLCRQFKEKYAMGFLVESWHAPGCSTPAKCGAKRKRALDRRIMDGDEVDSLYKMEGSNYWRRRFCATCYEHASGANAAGRKRMWEELPAIFDLPAWDQLKNEDV